MVELSELPELLAEIAEVAGLPAALAIAQFRGGTRTHFPANARDDHWLPVLVGREAADRLCAHFAVNHVGGVSVQMPVGPTGFYRVAQMRAVALREGGASLSETARTVGVTTRSVEKWCAQAREARRKREKRQTLGGVSGKEPAPAAELAPARVASAPNLLVEIAEVAGMAAALAVAQSRLRLVADFPLVAPDGHWLVEAVGRETADKLCHYVAEVHGGASSFMLPRPDPFLQAMVQRQAMTLREEGNDPEDVARILGVPLAQVEKWCAAERAKRTKRRADAAVAALIAEQEG